MLFSQTGFANQSYLDERKLGKGSCLLCISYLITIGNNLDTVSVVGLLTALSSRVLCAVSSASTMLCWCPFCIVCIECCVLYILLSKYTDEWSAVCCHSHGVVLLSLLASSYSSSEGPSGIVGLLTFLSLVASFSLLACS